MVAICDCISKEDEGISWMLSEYIISRSLLPSIRYVQTASARDFWTIVAMPCLLVRPSALVARCSRTAAIE